MKKINIFSTNIEGTLGASLRQILNFSSVPANTKFDLNVIFDNS